MKIATSTGDFREYLDWNDAAGAVRLLAQCGFRHIDLNMYRSFAEDSTLCSDSWREWAEGIRQAGNEAGVDFVQAHGSDGSFAAGEEYDRRIEILKRELLCRPFPDKHHPCRAVGASFTEKITKITTITHQVELQVPYSICPAG